MGHFFVPQPLIHTLIQVLYNIEVIKKLLVLGNMPRNLKN